MTPRKFDQRRPADSVRGRGPVAAARPAVLGSFDRTDRGRAGPRPRRPPLERNPAAASRILRRGAWQHRSADPEAQPAVQPAQPRDPGVGLSPAARRAGAACHLYDQSRPGSRAGLRAAQAALPHECERPTPRRRRPPRPSRRATPRTTRRAARLPRVEPDQSARPHPPPRPQTTIRTPMPPPPLPCLRPRPSEHPLPNLLPQLHTQPAA